MERSALPPCPRLELPGQQPGLLGAARHGQHGIITRHRADHLWKARSVNRQGKQLRLARIGPQYDQLLYRFHSPEVVGHRAA